VYMSTSDVDSFLARFYFKVLVCGGHHVRSFLGWVDMSTSDVDSFCGGCSAHAKKGWGCGDAHAHAQAQSA